MLFAFDIAFINAAFLSCHIVINEFAPVCAIVNSDSTTLSEDERNVVGHSIAEFTVTDADSGVNGMYLLYIDPPDTPVEIVKLGTHYSLNLTDSHTHRYVQGTITAMDTEGATDVATLHLVIVPQTAIVVLLVGSRLSPSLFKEQEAPKLKAGLEDAITGYQYAVYSVDRSGDE